MAVHGRFGGLTCFFSVTALAAGTITTAEQSNGILHTDQQRLDIMKGLPGAGAFWEAVE